MEFANESEKKFAEDFCITVLREEIVINDF